MKTIIYILSLLFVCSISAQVTIIVDNVPEETPENTSIFISGSFEGWSGGHKDYQLEQKDGVYAITLPKASEHIQFKFTQGFWESVECTKKGLAVENRSHVFNKPNDTLKVKIAGWTHLFDVENVSTATKNVSVLSEEFEIPQLNRKRRIWLYLPPNYDTSNKHYPVLYFQDGQNVFDVKTSYTSEWEVDETLNAMYNETGFELIVVAIDHGGDKRLNEYSAWDNEKYGKGEGELYLDFLVNNLKPEIDKAYRTKTDHNNTGIMGSSLGGLFAHYATVKRPDVFGKSGVFSPSFWYAEDGFKFTKEHPNNSKFYYLIGDKEGEKMVNYMNKMFELMESSGFSNIHKKIEPNGPHSESFWKTEFKQAISWLFINP